MDNINESITNSRIANVDLKALTHACRLCLDPSHLREWLTFISKANVNWEKVAARAYYHSAVPMLYQAVTRSGLTDQLPQKINAQLAASAHWIAAKNLDSAGELIRLMKIFHKDGLVAVPFKGAFLADNYYQNIGLRESVDIDLFIALEDLVKFEPIFKQLGYVAPFEASKRKKSDLLARDCEYNYDYYQGERRIHHVELHWQLAANRHNIQIEFEELQPYLIPGLIHQYPLQVFSPEASLLVTAAHHGGKDYWNSLRKICDVAFIVKGAPDMDWHLFLELAEKHRVLRICLHGLALSETLFGTPLPEFVRDSIKSRKILPLVKETLHFFALNEPWDPIVDYGRWFNYRLHAVDRRGDRYGLIYYNLRKNWTPNQADFTSIRLPSYLHFLYYITRPIRLLIAYFFRRKK